MHPPARPIGPCHFCGKMGHLRLYCPARAMAGNQKWYPFQCVCVAGVDVGYRDSKYRAVKCVNSANVIVRDGYSPGTKLREVLIIVIPSLVTPVVGWMLLVQ